MTRIVYTILLFILLFHSNLMAQEKSAAKTGTATIDVVAGDAEVAAKAQIEFKPDRLVTYKKTDQGILKLHVFSPSANGQAAEKAPAIVFFFGGGWNGGSPSQFYEQARFFADRGFVAMSAEYRVNKMHDTSPFECVEDAKSAVRWLRVNAEELGINPDQIVVSGGSAGGHLAACTGLIQGCENDGENLKISSRPNAMILFNPVLDTTEKGYGIGKVGEARKTDISPNHHVQSGVVPTLLFHGTADKTVPFENAKEFARLMKAAGNQCKLESFDGKGHGFFNGKFFRPKTKDTSDYERTMQASVEFLASLGFIDESETEATNTTQINAIANSAVANHAKRPNIVLIYTDDQGFGDVSSLNRDAKFKTPNFDRLAAEGISFTNAHCADSVCTPSRYALLTGRYPWRTKMKRSVLGAEADCLIADGRMTLPSFLRDNGYQTAMVGKWHLGMQFPGDPDMRDWSKPIEDMPLDKGFDYFYGIPASLNYGVLAWFEGRFAKVPPTLYSNKKKNPRHLDYRIMPPYEDKPGISTDPTRTIKKNFEIAADFIDNQCLTRFTDKAIEWMEGKVTDAKNEKPFFLYLPLTSPHYPVCPLPEFHGKGKAGAYGEFVIETDHHVGRVLDFLKKSGLEENTMVIFTSDNGPENSWKARIADFGHDSRGGFRGGKRSVYEGGHRVPFLVRWPAGIKSPGRKFDSLVGQTDLLATFAELIGQTLPENAGEDSQSFAPILLDPEAKRERLPLINHANGRGDYRYSITDKNLKLVMGGGGKSAELYDLSVDRAEENDLSKKHPETVARLTKSITEIVVNGRTTPGKAQANDSGHWEDLTWMDETKNAEKK